jgi:hypothetical protein
MRREQKMILHRNYQFEIIGTSNAKQKVLIYDTQFKNIFTNWKIIHYIIEKELEES